MKLKISLKKYWEENIILTVIILGFIELQTEAIHNILKWPMIAMGIILFIGCYLFHRINQKISVFIVAACILAVIEVVFSEGILATQYIWDLGICMPVALSFYYARHLSLKKWVLLYVVVSVYLLLRLFSSPDFYSIFYSHSRNYISVFEIFLMFMVAIVSRKNQREIPGWIYYFTAVICVIAVGRGGILAAFLLVGFHIFQNIEATKKNNNKKVKILATLFLFFIIFLVMVFFQDIIIQKFFPRFAGSGMSGDDSDIAVNKRLWMWGAYIIACTDSIKDFFLGSNPFPILLTYHYRVDFNIHNSYLMTHIFYGILGELAVMLCTLRFLKQLLKEKSEVAIILISFLFRAITDHCFPGKLSAIVIWFVIFYALDKPKNMIKGSVHE